MILNDSCCSVSDGALFGSSLHAFCERESIRSACLVVVSGRQWIEVSLCSVMLYRYTYTYACRQSEYKGWFISTFFAYVPMRHECKWLKSFTYSSYIYFTKNNLIY